MHISQRISLIHRPIEAWLQIHQMYILEALVTKIQFQRWIEKLIANDDYRHSGKGIEYILYSGSDFVLEALELAYDDGNEASQSPVELLRHVEGSARLCD